MKDTRKLPRFDFAAGPWQHRSHPALPKKATIDLSPRLELSVSTIADPDPPEPTEN